MNRRNLGRGGDQGENQTSYSLVGKTIDLKAMRVKVIEKIAEGKHGDMFRVLRLSDQKEFALKRMSISKDMKAAHQAYRNEIATRKRLGKHPNIVELVEVIETQQPSSPDGKDIFIL